MEVANGLIESGWAISFPQRGTQKIQHTVFSKTTKSGTTMRLDFHPGGGIHGDAYWKIYQIKNGKETIIGRIANKDFKKYDKINDSPIMIDEVIINSPKPKK